MKRNISMTAIISTMIAITTLAVLNETATVSLEEPPIWQLVAMLTAAFFGGVAVAAGSLWWLWEARIAKRNAELARSTPTGLEKSVFWMRRHEAVRIAHRRAIGLD